MIIKNWMHKNPVTISSEASASDAGNLLDEKKLPFIPVVDAGKLRGILTRRDLREAASCATATQSIHEVNYFNTRLKVKDLMIRMPLTLSVDDTVETALARGRQFGRSFFPVMDGGNLVGTISGRDITAAFHQILGVSQKLSGVTVEIDENNGEMEK